MAKVEADEIARKVEEVLRMASTGKGSQRGFLTAYQILNRLPAAARDRLTAEYGSRSGKDAGRPFGPASRVAQVAADLPGVEQRYLDTAGLQFNVGQPDEIEAGYNLCALFRLP